VVVVLVVDDLYINSDNLNSNHYIVHTSNHRSNHMVDL